MKKLFNFSRKENTALSEGFQIDTAIAEDFEDTTVTPSKTPAQAFLEWLEILVIAIIAVVVIFTLIFRIATIDGDSMNNTLGHGQRIIISSLGYTPKQGDIVVISRNVENSSEAQTELNTPIIKRVIAVGGQTVDIDFKTGTVFVDGIALDEPYTSSPTTGHYDVEFPKYVPEGYIFVLGDNRAVSLDSRSSQIGEDGLIDERYVLGQALFRIIPFEKAGRLDNK